MNQNNKLFLSVEKHFSDFVEDQRCVEIKFYCTFARRVTTPRHDSRIARWLAVKLFTARGEKHFIATLWKTSSTSTRIACAR